MPLLFQESFLPPGEWGLWRITESEDWLRGVVDLHRREHGQFECIKGAERRREFLAARLLLHLMSGRKTRSELVKDQDGKPHLRDSSFYISISHTVGYAAAIAHPRACGVDVQRIVPRIRRLAPKFVKAAERAALKEERELVDLHLIWAAKEAVYKAYGRRQLDFRRDMTVRLGERPGVELEVGGVRREFNLVVREYEGFVLVGAVEAGE